jgi:hypothetical protein
MSVEILSAWYGSEEGVLGGNVLEAVKAVQQSGAESMVVNNSVLTDTQVSVEKTLFVTYLVNGETKKLLVNEHSTLTFADLV